MLAVVSLVAALVVAQPHFVTFQPGAVQVGVAVDAKPNERLIVLVPYQGCKAGVRIYWGRYGDMDAALNFLAKSNICSMVERRAHDIKADRVIER